MRKVLTSVVIVALVLVMLFALTACNKYKNDPVGTKDYASQEAIGNGTLAVQQGNYLYFVNNVASDESLTKDKNEWKANGTNGAIMKSVINSDGTLECLGVVVPKMFYTDATNAGIYVYGEWIYYVARSQQTDNKGNLIESLEFMRTTIDGTKTESLAIVDGLTSNYVFTKTGLLYTVDSNIHYVDYSGKKIKDTEVVKEYTDLEVSEEDLCMFYTKANESDYILGNSLGVVLSDGTQKTIIAENSYYTGDAHYETNLSTMFALDIIGYNAQENAIFYTKTCKDTAAKVTTNGYIIPEDYTFDATKEVTYAVSALSSVYSLGVSKGIVDVSSSTLTAYAPMTDGIHEIKSDEVTMTGTITILFQEGDYTYYLMSSKLYRANLIKNDTINKNAYEEKISNAAMATTYGAPSYLGGFVYYESSDDATYLSRINISSYNADTQALVSGYIVSGYTAYTYEEDADYIINKDDESIKDKVPQFMTEDDLKTYITNHKSDKE